MDQCPNGHQAPPGAAFCAECGEPIVVPAANHAPPPPKPTHCPQGHPVPPGAGFCPQCGAPITLAVEVDDGPGGRPSTPAPPQSGEIPVGALRQAETTERPQPARLEGGTWLIVGSAAVMLVATFMP